MLVPKSGTESSSDALVGHHAGREDLAGQLGQPVQLADVVDGADETDDRRPHEHAGDLAAAVDPLEVRQLPRHQAGRGEPEEDRHAPEPRRRRRVDVALAHRREGVGRHGERADERGREVRDRTGDDEDEEVLAHGLVSGRLGSPSRPGDVRDAGMRGSGSPGRSPRRGPAARPGGRGRASPFDDRRGDELGDLLHLLGAHPLRGRARRADPDARGDVGLLRVERDGVLVEDDPGGVGPRLGLDAGDADPLEVVQRRGGCRCRRWSAGCRAPRARLASCWAFATTRRA